MITVQQAAGMNRDQRANYLGRVEQLLAKDKKNFDALMSGAALHYVNQDLETCCELLTRAHKVQKKDKMVLAWLSVALIDSHQVQKALAISQKLVSIAPGEANSWDCRGRVLDQAGRPAEALAAFEKVRKLAGSNPELEMQIANSYFYMGDHDMAEKGYLKVISMQPNHAMGLYGYSTVHKFLESEVDEYITKVEAALPSNREMPEYYTSALYYTAAKIYSDAKQHKKAFEQYKKANDVRRPQNTDMLSHPFEASRMAFPKSFFEDKNEWGDRFASPVFIVGMPRSGTTLVESLVGAHKSITSGGEMPFMDSIAMELGSMAAPDKFAQKVAGLSRKDVADLARKYLSEARAMAGTTGGFTDKMPHNFMNIGLIFLLFPKARVINCLRHPLDNCVSIYTNAMTPVHNYYKSDLTSLGRYYAMYEDIMAYWHDLFPGRILDVHYEDVISNTELNARKIIDFLGMSWQEDVMNRQQSQKAVRTLSAWQVRQPIYQSSSGRWRIYEKHLGPLVDELAERVDRYENALNIIQQQDAQ